MASIGVRFVGADRLPSRLSQFDAEAFFAVSTDDAHAVKQRFRADRYVGAALQLVFLRASVRTLDRFVVVPRALLNHIGHALGVAAPTIASLQSIYRRRPTLYEHQRWARERAEIADFDESAQHALRVAMQFSARDAASVEELVASASMWLYERKILLPAERTLRDFAREAFVLADERAIAAVEARIPRGQWPGLINRVYAKRRGPASTTVIEWLKTAAGRHRPGTLDEVLEKVALLRQWNVHEWDFGEAISLQGQQGYAHRFEARPPSVARRQLETSLVIEIVCFLRVTLLQLIDQALQMSGRRVVDLVRKARGRAEKQFTASAQGMRECLDTIREIVEDQSRPAEARLQSIREALTGVDVLGAPSRAGRTREALAEDSGGLRALLSQLAGLPFEGKDRDHGLRQWRILQDLCASSTTELPVGLELPVRRAWRDLVDGPDRRKALKAFEAALPMSMRTSLRRGSVWIAHSQAFRDREELLIPKARWEATREQHLELLRQPATPQDLLRGLRELLGAGLQAVSAALDKDIVEIRNRELHLPSFIALDTERELVRTRDLLFWVIAETQLPDILVEMDAATGFSQHLLAGRAKGENALLSLYAALLAHGTEVDAKGVAAMIPGVEVAHVSTAMRIVELPGRLRRANQAVLDFQARQPIAQHWGDGTTASADMMSLDASRHLWSARIDPRRRTPSAGIYTHVLNRHGIAYDMPHVSGPLRCAPPATHETLG